MAKRAWRWCRAVGGRAALEVNGGELEALEGLELVERDLVAADAQLLEAGELGEVLQAAADAVVREEELAGACRLGSCRGKRCRIPDGEPLARSEGVQADDVLRLAHVAHDREQLLDGLPEVVGDLLDGLRRWMTITGGQRSSGSDFEGRGWRGARTRGRRHVAGRRGICGNVAVGA